MEVILWLDKDVIHMQLVYETRNVCILITPYA